MEGQAIRESLLEQDCGLMSLDELTRFFPAKYRGSAAVSVLCDHFLRHHQTGKENADQKVSDYIAGCKPEGASLENVTVVLDSRKRKLESIISQEEDQISQLEDELQRITNQLEEASSAQAIPQRLCQVSSQLQELFTVSNVN
eukprot:TRINITY_DN28692_c0_g1_i1.p1 TRINITY_DN28692_c0_g1~~TRINITY_DN28692_c0_g1_i1.p1  ORF type:complete len:143 (+),score=25.04 TRINITY_DN28692_c0_g1_i1:70-498(+)